MSIDTTGSAQAIPLAIETVRQTLQTEQTTAQKVAEDVANASEVAAQDKQKISASADGRGAHVDVNV